MTKFLKILGFTILALIIISTVSIIWLDKNTDACWKQEADMAIQKYQQGLKRQDILQLDLITKDHLATPVEIIEKDPNGCSVAGNGQTVVKLYFNNRDTLSAIEVYRNFIGSDQQMVLIKKQTY